MTKNTIGLLGPTTHLYHPLHFLEDKGGIQRALCSFPRLVVLKIGGKMVTDELLDLLPKVCPSLHTRVPLPPPTKRPSFLHEADLANVFFFVFFLVNKKT